MKTDYTLTREDIANEIERCGYAIVSARLRVDSSSRRIAFLLAKPVFDGNSDEFGYYYYVNGSNRSKLLKNYLKNPTRANCDVTWEDLLRTFAALNLEHLTLFDLVNK